MRFREARKLTALLLTVSQNLNVCMHLDSFESVWFKVGMMIDTIKLYICSTSLLDLDLDSRSQECEKAKTSAPTISKSFQLISVEFGRVLKFIDVINLIPI